MQGRFYFWKLVRLKIFDSSYDEVKDEDQFDINNLSYHNRNNQHI